MRKHKKCLILDRHKKLSLTLERCFYCNEKIGKSYVEKMRYTASLISLEKKQKLLDALFAGSSVGEAMKKVDPGEVYEHGVWYQILSDNISKHYYLNREVI